MMIEILLIVPLSMIIWGIYIYNNLIRDKNRMHEGWSDIDVQLKLRHNLIPNLVTTTQQYAKYEQATLSAVTELRNQSSVITQIDQKGKIEEKLGSGLHKLIALVENYPELKASENFIRLQDELIQIEEKLQYARRYYNGAVRNLNINIERFPNLFIAKMFHFQSGIFFQVESDTMRQSTKVNL